jgi:hypothetical protein
VDLVNTIIFSKDRAAQLDALLRSAAAKIERFAERGRWAVIHAASTPEFARGYETVRGEHAASGVEFIAESGATFKQLVVQTMQAQRAANNAAHCMFLVDDMIFKSPWPVGGKPMARLKQDPRVLCLSLRMCPRYDYCYAQDRPQKVPRAARWLLRWRWRKAACDWGYPMSVDGHIFRFDDLFPLVQRVDFRHPNSFEAALAQNAIKSRPLMTCYREAVVVNLPVNRVQDDFANRAGEQHGISAIELNAQFLQGKRVDLEPVYALRDNRGCHHEMPMRLV